MKKVCKVLLKIAKWYMIFDALLLAYIGCGQLAKKMKEKPELSMMDTDIEIINEATNNYKRFLRK